MVNEWVKVEAYGANNDGRPRRYTIADGASVSKGQLLGLSDPRTAFAATDTTTVYAGVASEDHPAGQSITSVSAWTDGIFEAVASMAILVPGAPITGGTTNQIMPATPNASGAQVLGYALEIGTLGESINVRLDL